MPLLRSRADVHRAKCNAVVSLLNAIAIVATIILIAVAIAHVAARV